MSALCDQHSVPYEFEELRLEVSGVRLEWYVSGTAELAHDPGYSFYVKSIALDGTRLEPAPKLGRLSRDRIRTALTLKRPDATDRSEEAQLFRLIENAIYDDKGACRAWQAEVEAA